MVARSRTRLAIALAAALASVSHAQQPIDAPLLKPFADNRDWVLFADLVYRIGESAHAITVPRGFVTDFASIPQPFWGLGLSPNGRYSKAAIVHDWLYWSQGCTRRQADNILMIAMKESLVDATTRTAIYEGVRVGGESAWIANAADKAVGLPRVIPEGGLAFGPTVLWAEYRRALAQPGTAERAGGPAPTYCAAGDATDVPGPPP